MAFNLIAEAWIPVRTLTGTRVIRPDQICDPDVLFPDWPRADLNIACLEMLIGLVYMADPPEDEEDWEDRIVPDGDRLRTRLQALIPAFNLDGDGPRFLQDFEVLSGDIASPDLLFIDSAGDSTAKKNADLMVWRDRYPHLDQSLAAMALYTLQSHAPAGGAGNRTSMRGGGPLVTLVQPKTPGLWNLVWANVPYGKSQGPQALPWMKPTRLSEGKVPATLPPEGNRVEAEVFFGMPRRLRLIFDEQGLKGVIQRPWGTNYEGWVHPLSPYYRPKIGAELLPVPPQSGGYGYRNWLGTIVDMPQGDLARRASALITYEGRVRDPSGASVIVARWSMDNMKPRDFILSQQPLLKFPREQLLMLEAMIEAAELMGCALRMALKAILFEGVGLEALCEEFFVQTEPHLQLHMGNITSRAALTWVDQLRQVALTIFDKASLPGLQARGANDIAKIVNARGLLVANLAGKTGDGKKALAKLQAFLPDPENQKTDTPQELAR